MPIAPWFKVLFSDRVEFETDLNRKEVEQLLANPQLKVLQCSGPVEMRTWELLNDRFFSRRPEVELRLYGFYNQVCDLAFTPRMTHVRRFSADTLMQARGMEHLPAMQALESLGVGIFNLEDFEFLTRVTPQLKRLFLGPTRSKKPDLSPLERFTQLEEIFLEGQQKQIEVLSELKNLQDVTLRSISTPDISYLRPLERLWSLDIKLGGITDLSALAGREQIKYLELWQIRGLSDIGVISSLEGLQYLFLQSLPNITALPALRRLAQLRRIYLENMKGLTDLSSLESAPALEEFIHTRARNLQPEDYLALLRNPQLLRAGVWFGSEKKNRRFAVLREAHGIAPLEQVSEFEFR